MMCILKVYLDNVDDHDRLVISRALHVSPQFISFGNNRAMLQSEHDMGSERSETRMQSNIIHSLAESISADRHRWVGVTFIYESQYVDCYAYWASLDATAPQRYKYK